MCDPEQPPCRKITTLHTYKTEYNADSVEWCPHKPNQNLFVCANYQLKESDCDSEGKRKRVGCILLFSVTEDDLQLLQTIYTAATLDQKWCHNQIDGYSLLGVVNAEKSLEIYRLKTDNNELEFVTRYQIDDDENETLLLSLDWSTGKHQSDEPEIICSDSRGTVHRFKLSNSHLVKESSWKGHEFEAWIAGFYYWDTNVFFSGGDDCHFLKYDRRVSLEPAARNRGHEAGVTSLHSNSEKEYVLATGSYDMNVRLWDIRYLKNSTSCVKTPGTLWRLKWDPFDHTHLLAACMLGGVHILTDTLEIIDSYYQHKSISYGADWSFDLPLIATCSFYDNLLCVSKMDLHK